MEVIYSETDSTVWLRLVSVWSYLSKITKTDRYNTDVSYNIKDAVWIVKVIDNGNRS